MSDELKFSVLCLAITATVSCCLLSLTACATQLKHKYVVVVGDLTNKKSDFGNALKRGVEYQTKLLSALSESFTLTPDYIDDQGSEELSYMQAFDAITRNEVIAVIGHSTSGTTKIAEELYGPAGLLVLLPIATNPDITLTASEKGWKNIYRLVPNDDFQATKIAETCRDDLTASTAVLLSDSEEYSTTLRTSLSRALHEYSIQVLLEKQLVPNENDAIDFMEPVNELRLLNPDVIVFSGYSDVGGTLVKYIRSANIQSPIVLTDGCFPPARLFSEIGTNPGKVYVAFVAPDWVTVPCASDLLQNWDHDSNNLQITYEPFAADAFSLIHTACEDLITQGKQPDREILLEYFEQKWRSTGALDIAGCRLIAGPYSFNSNGDNELGRNYIFECATSEEGALTWKQIH